MKYMDELRERLNERLHYPRSREWWTRDRTTLCSQREPNWPTPSHELSDFATPDEIATAIAGVEQAWRDIGRRVKALNRAAPAKRTIEATRTMSEAEKKAAREAWLVTSYRREVKAIINALRDGRIDGSFGRYGYLLREGKIDGSDEVDRLLVAFEERANAAHRAACDAFEANWKAAPVDDATWEEELRRRGWCIAREIVEQQLSPEERELRRSGGFWQSRIYDLVIKRTDALMAAEGERFIAAARALSDCRCESCRNCYDAKKCLEHDRVMQRITSEMNHGH
jgi:hypothetical protein